MITDLEKTTSDLNKRFGANTVIKLSDEFRLDIARIATGSLKIDDIVGGGIPIGRITEIYGDYSSGKSTLALHIIATAQKQGMTAVYVDGEHALDPIYAKALGVDVESLYVSQPDYLEQALEITEAYLKQGAIVVFDSTNSLPSRVEREESFGDVHVGVAAKLFSQACRKINPLLKEKQGTLIFISQIRTNINVTGWGLKTVAGVGNAVKFYASVRLDMTRIGTNKEQGQAVSNEVKIVCRKNKTAPPFRDCTITLKYGVGIDQIDELVDIAVEKEIMQKTGAWFSVIDENGEIVVKKQGKPNMCEWLAENPNAYQELRNKVLLQLTKT